MRAAEIALRDEGATESEITVIVGYQEPDKLATDIAYLGGMEKWAKDQLGKMRASSVDTPKKKTLFN
jgi:hypothetical protein